MVWFSDLEFKLDKYRHVGKEDGSSRGATSGQKLEKKCFFQNSVKLQISELVSGLSLTVNGL